MHNLRIWGRSKIRRRRCHIWNCWPWFAYSLLNFYMATITIKGSLLLSIYYLICRRVRKKMYTRHDNFFLHPFSQKPPVMNLYQIWFRVSSRRRNELCRSLLQLAQGFRFCKGSKFALPTTWPVDVNMSLCWRYRAACDNINFGSRILT